MNLLIWSGLFSNCCFCTGSIQTAAFALDKWVCMWAKSRLLTSYSPVALLDTSPTSFQSQTLGICLFSACPKGWDACCGAQTLHSSSGSSVFVSPLWWWVVTLGVGLLVKIPLCLSYRSRGRPFSLRCGVAVRLVPRFFWEGNVPHVEFGVSMGGSELGTLLCSRCELPLQHTNFRGTQTPSHNSHLVSCCPTR